MMRTVELDLRQPIHALRIARFAEKNKMTVDKAVEFFLQKKVAPYLSKKSPSHCNVKV